MLQRCALLQRRQRLRAKRVAAESIHAGQSAAFGQFRDVQAALNNQESPVGKHENPIMFRGLAEIFMKPPQIACTRIGSHKEMVIQKKIAWRRFSREKKCKMLSCRVGFFLKLHIFYRVYDYLVHKCASNRFHICVDLSMHGAVYLKGFMQAWYSVFKRLHTGLVQCIQKASHRLDTMYSKGLTQA